MNDNQAQDGASTSATGEILKPPFPWFGGKSRAAPQVWAALGDVSNYVEPFAGSLAVLLGRPDAHVGETETVNDKDMYLSNFWRALAADPEAVAYYADWPVNEADLFSRHLWLVNEGRQQMAAGMAADPDWYDARIAGWWVWGQSCWIGGGWCRGNGPHTYAGQDVDDETRGVNRQRPHLGNAGQGVNRQLPHLGNAGKGVNRRLPHLGDAGMGVNRRLPNLGNAGMGVQRASNDDLIVYMQALAARLRRVRVCCGDWSRVVTRGAMSHGATVGVFLDPPYHAATGRVMELYNEESGDVSEDVRRWAIEHGDDPRLRIVLAGYDTEHVMPDAWRVASWTAIGGYSKRDSASQANRHRERLWLSPHCLRDDRPNLFGD